MVFLEYPNQERVELGPTGDPSWNSLVMFFDGIAPYIRDLSTTQKDNKIANALYHRKFIIYLQCTIFNSCFQNLHDILP